MLEDYRWFEEQYDRLRSIYGDSFLAIKNKRVLNAYSSYGDAVRETQKTEPLGTFIVQECLGSGEVIQCCIASMNFS